MPEVVLLTTSQVAKRFRVDSSAVRRWVSKNLLTPAVTTPGGHYRFSEEAVAAFEASGGERVTA
ncbi:helix-turn-helix domain-containing protein [Mycobacterium kansasii]